MTPDLPYVTGTLTGDDRQRVIDEHLAWLRVEQQTELDWSGAPISWWLERRRVEREQA